MSGPYEILPTSQDLSAQLLEAVSCKKFQVVLFLSMRTHQHANQEHREQEP